MKVQQTIAACIGWRRKYQKPFELIGVGVKQFHSGERKAALATKLSSWKSAILFNARPVAREALRVKITDLCVCVYVCVRVREHWFSRESAKAVRSRVFLLIMTNDVKKFRESIDLEKWGSFLQGRILEWLFLFLFTGKVGRVTFFYLLNDMVVCWCCFLSVQFWEVKVTSKNCIYRVVEVEYWKIIIFYDVVDYCEFSNFLSIL